MVGNCKTVLPRQAYGDEIRNIDLCAPLEACASGAGLGNRSVIILDPRLWFMYYSFSTCSFLTAKRFFPPPDWLGNSLYPIYLKALCFVFHTTVRSPWYAILVRKVLSKQARSWNLISSCCAVCLVNPVTFCECKSWNTASILKTKKISNCLILVYLNFDWYLKWARWSKPCPSGQDGPCEINSAHQKLLGLVEMTSGLVNASFSSPCPDGKL